MVTIPPKPWPTGLAEDVEPLVKRVLAPNPSPYTFTGTQTYVVGEAHGPDCAVIDPGPNEPDHIDAIIAAVAGRRVLAIMCTHTHRDHSPAAAPLAARTGAPIVGCAPLVLKSDLPRADESFDATYAPDRVLLDGEAMRGTGWTLTAVATPGHTSNHLCFALEESGALFTGDHVMGWSTSVVIPPDGDMGDYMASLEKLLAREDRVYHSAHGAAIEKPRQLVRGMIGHRRQRENQIMRLLGEAARPVSAFIPAMYKGLDERLIPAAEMSVTAHLIDLEKRGMASHKGGVWRSH
ncbi:MBL fold metallo-hydrolase [Erythrobacter dokdonensis]|uniref:Metallo-beta-lactamase family protein n=1 Tax=Erythrobacter dokdonensis DSW-74 TaxID=1300349 RepID=A0A1A7BIK2_9SPHN|nr:MBL fold metallo-hydrolase [Erythrobacter dokdonensis]OBV11277.1 Metallo-beta-lactamase family protein [Erythrobacter dokdonensis DSW-74]